MSFADQVLPQANAAYKSSFTKGELPMPPAKKLAIVTCMDARIDPFGAFGISEGDAHVIRNAGGRTSEALRSLIISQELLGTREIIVVHHTDCGMLTFASPTCRSLVAARVAPSQQAALDSIAFLEFNDVKESTVQDVEFLRDHPLIIKETPVSGFIYDVKTGGLEKVA